MEINLHLLNSELLDATFDLATEVFIGGSTLHRALGIGLTEYRAYLRPSFEAMAAEELSVVALNGGEVVGCLILTDFFPIVTVHPEATGKFRPLAALTEALCAQYRTHRTIQAGEAVLADMGAVSPRAAGSGTYQQMRAEAQRIAREKGFTRIVGELSSRATQHVVLNKLKHKKLGEVRFAEFEFGVGYPFASISDPPSLVLAEGTL